MGLRNDIIGFQQVADFDDYFPFEGQDPFFDNQRIFGHFQTGGIRMGHGVFPLYLFISLI
jgi:hypothetical protein